MLNALPEIDFDEFREELIVYLAERLDVSRPEALSLLGEWLTGFGERAYGDQRGLRNPDGAGGSDLGTDAAAAR